MAIIAIHSNRLYKKQIDADVVMSISNLIAQFNKIKTAAYVENLARLRYDAMAAGTAPIVRESLYKTISAKLPDASIYLVNSAINEAKGIQDSRDELLKLEIKTLKTKIDKVKTKIERVQKQKEHYQIIKDNLKLRSKTIKDNRFNNSNDCESSSNSSKKSKKDKSNEVPIFKARSTKYKLVGDQVVITTGRGKSKVETTYSLYLFETEYLKEKQKQYKQRFGALNMRLFNLEVQLAKMTSNTYYPQVVFGGKKLQKQAYLEQKEKADKMKAFNSEVHTINNKHKNHKKRKISSKKLVHYGKKTKLQEYKYKRSNSFIVSGRNDSKVGNYVFNYDYNHHQMVVTINKKQTAIADVFFPYGSSFIEEYYVNQANNYKVKGSSRKPITYSIKDYGEYYIITCMLDISTEPLVYDANNGVIGVDTNLGFWSVANITPTGQLESSVDITYDWRNKTSGQVKASIRNAAVRLVDIALRGNKPIVIEDLKIGTSAKLKDYNSNKSKNFGSNMFAYHKMTEALMSRANKCGVQVYVVSSEYTSLIGKAKYMSYYKRPVHNLAAFVIGRRYLNLNEIIPKRFRAANIKTWPEVYKEIKTQERKLLNERAKRKAEKLKKKEKQNKDTKNTSNKTKTEAGINNNIIENNIMNEKQPSRNATAV